MRLIAAAIACVLFADISAAAVLDGPIINPANGHSYYLLEPASWTESQAEAELLGGNLVTIDDQEENDWVLITFGGVPGQKYLWLGLNDFAQEGTFEWADSTPIGYTNWFPGEPNNQGGDENAVLFPWNAGGTWNDVNRSGGIGSATVCGVVEVGIPEPATALLLAASVVSLAGVRRRWA
ncbi:Lectin C-type domain protein [Posidoniimonas polymericola]|uniref:Lectin C-type domain protein n=1 Tax=Posidoniimonas polymericola TaxID=2528002 RepID=A0A5C5YSB6_9BACT|nr:lectin-like protein [Posidoniimonas polymericola]TWT77872.1 Lectin C-type domain protein [Posidoniimonas polymericola]